MAVQRGNSTNSRDRVGNFALDGTSLLTLYVHSAGDLCGHRTAVQVWFFFSYLSKLLRFRFSCSGLTPVRSTAHSSSPRTVMLCFQATTNCKLSGTQHGHPNTNSCRYTRNYPASELSGILTKNTNKAFCWWRETQAFFTFLFSSTRSWTK